MTRMFFFALLPLVACHSSPRTSLLTSDSLQKFDLQDQQALAVDIERLNDVYKKQIDLAEHSEDDSIRYYQDQLGLAQAAGKNVFIQLNIEKKINALSLKAAKKGVEIASSQAKREMDMVYAAKFREQKEKELYELQHQLDSNTISQLQYDEGVKHINARVDTSPVTEANALKMSIEYNKQKYADLLDKQQKLLEARIDSESKRK